MVMLIPGRRPDKEGTGGTSSWEGWEVGQISPQLEL